jgi:hypothetical protein
MPRICILPAHRRDYRSIPIFSLTLLSLIALSTAAFSQDSFMVRYSAATNDGVQLARGDVNNDGIPDLIMGNNGGSSGAAVTVFLGNGDGTFKAPLDSGLGSSAFDMTVGDFNGDGFLDVAVGGYVNGSQGVLEILLGNGDGTFRAGQTINLPDIPRSITVGDFNGDGKLDIALAIDQMYFYQGAGDGTFTSAATLKVGNQSLLYESRVGDFNGDGKPDVAVSDGFKVYVLWNTGPFTFTTTTIASYVLVTNITAVDVNQDHYTDLLTTYYTCTQNGEPACPAWQVLLGAKGKQSMTTGFSLPPSTTYSGFGSLTAADINGDGFNDVVALTSSFKMAVWLGNRNGGFQTTPLLYSTGTNTSADALVASDFNRDGKIDFAVADPGNIGMAVLLNATPQVTTCTAGAVSPSITECAPVDYTYLNSPLHITARTTDNNHTVTTMQVYLNNALATSQSANFLNYSTTLSDGDYLVVTKAWDSTGANFRTDRHVQIYTGTPGETCATAANAINVCSPTQNQTTTTSVHVFANSQSSFPISAMQVYIDGSLVYDDTSGSTYVDTTFKVAAGTHSIVAKAWDTAGTIFSESRTITAQ